MTSATGPRSILMSVDAVGGVWRYAMDLARGLKEQGVSIVFAGFGPMPDKVKIAEAEQIGWLFWSDLPLDWMAEDASELEGIADHIDRIVAETQVELVHINLPSQAVGLSLNIPVVCAAHSCVASWFQAVRNTDVPPGWTWQKSLTERGLQAADHIIVPSQSFARQLSDIYGELADKSVIYNASKVEHEAPVKQPYVFAAARWWDDGKNGAVLDAAAQHVGWPVVMAGAVTGPSGQTISLNDTQCVGELGFEAVTQHMRDAAIFVSPSIYEPFGLAPLEAARKGCALVLADIPIYRELWQDSAIFADPREPQAFAQAIEQLITSEEALYRMALAAAERSANFTIERQVSAVSQVYAQLVSSRPNTAAAE